MCFFYAILLKDMKKVTIGIIGITGDLGSQLARALTDHDFTVVGCSLSLPEGLSIADVVRQADIVHVCAPLSTMEGIVVKDDTLIILHDSVMASSLQAQKHYLGGQAAIVHLLMNTSQSVVIAEESSQFERTKEHLGRIGYVPHAMTVVAHDQLMARSQAPLAILCQVLLPYLFEQQDKGLLTPSGELLAKTLHSRQLAWTDETIRSILSNPELKVLLSEMTTVMNEASEPALSSYVPEKVHKKYSLGAAIRRLQRTKH